MKNRIRFTLAVFLVLVAARAAEARVRVVASTTDLASIARTVGGDLIEVRSIAPGSANVHFIEILPSYMVQVKKADVYLKIGLTADLWADRIIDGSRNGKLLIVDCSTGITPLNVPAGRVDASMGDIHPDGNPHYWLDPDNGAIVAETIAGALATIDAANADAYRAGAGRFRSLLDAKKREWALLTAHLHGREIVTFHDTWPYFCRAFALTVAGFVEPKPGIEPSPSHTAATMDLIRTHNIRVIGVETYYSRRTPDTIARETGATVVELPTSVSGVPEATDYFQLFDVLLKRLATAMEGR